MFYGLSKLESYYKEKVSIFIALAPVSMIPNTKVDALKLGAYLYNELQDTFRILDI